MALSFVTYTGNGSNRIFNLTFTYLQQADVSVKVNNVAVTFTFLDSARVQTSVAPASGAFVEVRRTSSRTARVVDFQDGAVLTEAALDGDSNQLFQLTQEAFDASETALPLVFDQTYDATTKRIKNVADPTSAQDAVTKNWAETSQTSSIGIATTKASEASSSATAAANSATASANSASGAASSTTAAANSATASATSATAALASKNTSAAQAAISTTKAGQAASSATAAANSATASASSASTASTQAGLATSNGAAQVVLATAQVVLATAQKALATTKASEASTSANNAASSLASFTGQYVSSSSAPASPSTGDLWFDTGSSTMKVYNGSAFANAGSSVSGVENAVQHTATAGQTSFSATYDAGHLQVFLNGIRLDTADYTATNGNAVVLAVAASVGDVVFIQGFGTFTLADHYTKTVADGRFKAIGALEGGPSLGTNSILRYNANTINENISVSSGLNAFSAGPITIANNKTVTIANNATWSII